MSTIKTKNIKQTVINSTVQPLKIGGILEDGSDAKISIGSDGTTALKGTAQSLETIVDYTVQTSSNSVTISGLDINTHKGYRVVYEGQYTSNGWLSLYINGDTTATNYYNQLLDGGGTSTVSARTNNSQLTLGYSGNPTFMIMEMNLIGSQFYANARMNRWYGASLEIELRNIIRVPSTSNVTSFTITSDTGNIASGTKIKIYRLS